MNCPSSVNRLNWVWSGADTIYTQQRVDGRFVVPSQTPHPIPCPFWPPQPSLEEYAAPCKKFQYPPIIFYILGMRCYFTKPQKKKLAGRVGTLKCKFNCSSVQTFQPNIKPTAVVILFIIIILIHFLTPSFSYSLVLKRWVIFMNFHLQCTNILTNVSLSN